MKKDIKRKDKKYIMNERRKAIRSRNSRKRELQNEKKRRKVTEN